MPSPTKSTPRAALHAGFTPTALACNAARGVLFVGDGATGVVHFLQMTSGVLLHALGPASAATGVHGLAVRTSDTSDDLLGAVWPSTIELVRIDYAAQEGHAGMAAVARRELVSASATHRAAVGDQRDDVAELASTSGPRGVSSCASARQESNPFFVSYMSSTYTHTPILF